MGDHSVTEASIARLEFESLDIGDIPHILALLKLVQAIAGM